MPFFSSAVTVLQTLVIALGAGLGIWGVINLLEGYGTGVVVAVTLQQIDRTPNAEASATTRV